MSVFGKKSLNPGDPIQDGGPGDDAFNAPAGSSGINGFGGIDTVAFNFRLVDATISYSGATVIIDSATSHTELTGIQTYVFTDGTMNENDGNALVDDLYYYSRNHDLWTVNGDAEAHFAQFGWQEGRNPSAFFNTKLYLVANSDVRAAGVDPLEHFHTFGWKEGRLPSINFDTFQYLQNNPDVAAAGVDPLEHFLAVGRDEGRASYMSNFSVMGPSGFDHAYYLLQNPDVAAAEVDPLEHFLTFGWREGRDPNAWFDTRGYLATYTDVAAAGVNPFEHYLQFGWKEGRNPLPAFDSEAYLLANPDVAAAGVNPLVHYLQYGVHEGRSAFSEDFSTIFDPVVLEGSATGTVLFPGLSWGNWISPLLSFTLTGDSSGGGFAVNSATGALTIANGSLIDFETSGGAHTLTVLAQLGSLSKALTFTVGVTDAAPTISSNAPTGNILEGAANGTMVGITVTGSDPNGPAPIFTLANDAGGRFTIDAAGIISVANGAAIDFETAPGHTYSLTARATVGALSADLLLTINVGNVNEAPAGADHTAEVAENSVHTFTAADFGFTDPNDNPTPNNLAGVVITAITGAGSLTNNGTPVANGDFVSAADIAAGNLKFTPAANANGNNYASFAFQVRDDGGTANGGENTDQSANTMTIDVNAVNDTPSFTVGADQTVNEDGGPQTVNGFATGISAGPADEAGQAVDFIVSNNNNALFAVQPTIDASGNLTYTPAADANGGATVTVQIHDNGGGADTSVAQTFVINVNSVNDTPSFTVGADQTVNEDAAPQTVNGFATGISAGPANEAGQAVDFILSNNNNALFAVQPTIDASGNLTYTPAADASGSATVTVQIHDNGGGADTSVAQTFVINVNAVNDTPSFTVGADQTVNEDGGPQTVNGFATGISAGPADEAGQAVDFIVSNNNNALFAVQPTIDASGNLTYTPAADANGGATVTVQIHDNGGGADTSVAQTFVINVNAVNDTPSFTVGANQTVNEDAGQQTVNGFATGISAGPANEAGQAVDFILSNNNNALFAVQPTIDASGNLTYTPAADASGSATVTVQIHDNGGGADTSVAQTFVINVNAVNDAPTAANLTQSLTINEDAAATTLFTVAPAANDIDSATATATLTLADPAAGVLSGGGFAPTATPGEYKFSGSPAAVATALAAVQFDSANNFFGSTSVSALIDDGFSGPQGTNPTGTVSITVNPVNDEPTLVATAVNPNYTPAADLFAGVITSTVESGQLLDRVVLTVSNVTDLDESLTIDGVVVALTDGNDSVSPTATLGVNYTVDVVGTTATITITSAGGLTELQMAGLIDGLKYTKTTVPPGAAPRVVTIVSLQDDGGTANGGDDTANPGITSTVSFNQPPTIAVDGVVNYTENDPATVIDATITVADADDANLEAATVEITGGFTAGDELLFTNTATITGTLVGDTLTLTGIATKAEYEAALESITYRSTSENPTNATRTISFTVNDGAVNSAADTATINVTAVNDNPVVATSGFAPSFTEDGSATFVDSGFTVSDLDNATLQTATLVLDAATYQNGFDTLNFTNAFNITGSFTAATGTLTLTNSGSATMADWQSALQSVTFSTTSQSPGASRIVHATVNDGTADSTTVDKTITVVSVNDAPVLSDIAGSLGYIENDPATIVDGAVTLTDADGSNLPIGAIGTVRIATNYQNGQDVLAFTGNAALFNASFNAALGTLTLTALVAVTLAQMEAALESVTYVNTSENPSGLDRTVEFQVNDGAGANNLSNTPTRTINVTPVNDAPVVTPNAGGAFTENGAAVDVAGSGVLTDVDSTNLTQVTVTLTNLQANDVLSMQTVAGLSGELANGVDFTITGGNVVTLTGGDNFAEYQSALQEVQFSNTSENPNTTARAFTIEANDGAAANNLGSANVNVSVTAVNDAPINNGVPGEITVHSNTAFKITGLSIGDVDAGSANTVNTTFTAAAGTVAIGNGTSGGNAGIAGGATVTTNGTGTVTLTGTVAQINLSLTGNNVAYTAADNVTIPTTTTLTITTNDAGNTGVDPGLSGNGTSEADVDVIDVGVLPQVWFINQDQSGADASTPRGSQANPFATVAEFNAAALTATGPGPNDYIYVKAGTYSGEGINLENGQTLLGDDQALSFTNPLGGPDIVIETSAGARPTISVAAANATDQGIDLASGNTIRGINIVTNAAGQSGIDDGNNGAGTTDDAVGAVTITNVQITGVGKAIDIDEGGALTVTLDKLTSTGSSTQGIDLGGGLTGSLTVNDNTSSISGATGAAFNLAGGGSLSVTFNGSMTQASNAALVSVAGGAGGHTGTITFQNGTLTATNGTGLQFDNDDGTYNFNGTNTLSNTVGGVTADAGIDVVNGSNGNFTFSANTAISNPNTGADININGGTGNFTYNGTITDDVGQLISVANKTGGTVGFSGSITDGNDGDGNGISVSGNSGGTTVNFTGQTTLSTGGNTAVNLTNNAGATINFNAAGNGLDITTTTGIGFNATGPGPLATSGGTVNVQGTGNTISSAGGTALNVVNTTIGANDLNFQSISANGGASGIVLNNTGTSGGLTVTGDGGGTNNGSGGTIQNTTGDGVSLTNTMDVNLARMNITNNLGDGIGGTTINGMVLDRLNISGNGNDAATDESGINIVDLTGTASNGAHRTAITNSVISSNFEFEIQITNHSGTLTNLQFLNNTVTAAITAGLGGNVFNFLGDGTSTMGLTVQGGSLTGNYNPASPPATITGTGVHADTSGTAMTVNVSGATFTGNNAGVNVSTGPGNSTLTFNISNNTFTDTRSTAINIFNNGNAPFGRTVNGTITGNVIGDGSDFSGSTVGRGIDVGNEGSINLTVLISGNTIQDIGTPGINSTGSSAIASNIGLGGSATGGGTTNLTIINNNISDIQDSRAILVDESQDTTGGGPFPTVFVNISGNTIGGFIGGQAGDGSYIRVDQDNGTVKVTQKTPTGAADPVGPAADPGELDDANGFNDPSKVSIGGTVSFNQGTPPTPPPTGPLPLLAADGGIPAGSGQSGDHDLTTAELSGIVEAAIARWVATGLSEEQLAALDGLTFAAADLGGANLGSYMAGLVLIDNDAAGRGWFIDASPLEDGEFGHALSAAQLQTDPSGAPAGQMDLLTSVMHEIGHVLGLDHTDDSSSGDLMSGQLVTGERRLPSAGDAVAVSTNAQQPSEAIRAQEIVGQNIVGGFDAEYYLAHNPDVAAAGVDPLAHYNTFGWHEGRNPNAYFDAAGYLAHYADVAAAGVNPLEHFAEFGWREGRDPSAGFDTQGYLAANPDVAAAQVNPLEHYLNFGVHEGRTPVNDGLWH